MASDEAGLVERLSAVRRLEAINRSTGGYGWPPSDPTLLADVEAELTRLRAEAKAMREALEFIADFRTVDLSAEWEASLRDIIRSCVDCARAALAQVKP